MSHPWECVASWQESRRALLTLGEPPTLAEATIIAVALWLAWSSAPPGI